jgi:hypothetical protein
MPILKQAKTTSVNHPYMSKEARLEAGRARLRIAAAARLGHVSDDVPLTVVFEANLTIWIF